VSQYPVITKAYRSLYSGGSLKTGKGGIPVRVAWQPELEKTWKVGTGNGFHKPVECLLS